MRVSYLGRTVRRSLISGCKVLQCERAKNDSLAEL